MTTSGLCALRLAQQIRRVGRDADDLEAGLLEDADDPFADEQLVLADDDANGHAGNASASGYPNGRGARHRPCCSHAGRDHPRDRARADAAGRRRGCAPGSTGARPGPAIPRAAWLTTSPRSSPRSRPRTRCADDLRLLALVHDSFKAEVRPHEHWSPDNDHATLARRFAERYTSDERLLSTLELHDEPYWIWRHADAPEPALQTLLGRLPDLELFAHFVELDAANEGKDLTFLWWFRRELAISGRLPDASGDRSRRGRRGRRLRQGIRHRAAPAAGHRVCGDASSSPSNGPGWAPRARS